MKKIGPRVNEKADEYLTKNFRNRSAGAEYILNATPAVARKFMGLDLNGMLVKAELNLMIDVMNGTALTPDLAGQHLPLNVVDGIALDGLDEKWGVDAEKLNQKLAGMSTPELMFLEIWIQGFWERLGTDSEIPLEEYV